MAIESGANSNGTVDREHRDVRRVRPWRSYATALFFLGACGKSETARLVHHAGSAGDHAEAGTGADPMAGRAESGGRRSAGDSGSGTVGGGEDSGPSHAAGEGGMTGGNSEVGGLGGRTTVELPHGEAGNDSSAGHAGATGDPVTDACSAQPCHHGAACEPVAQGFRCTCHPLWAGLTCDDPVGGVVTLAAIDRGFWRATGGHVAGNGSTLTDGDTHSYFVFDIPSLGGTLASVSLRLEALAASGNGEFFRISDVTTPAVQLMSTSDGNVETDIDIFNDLGGGIEYGSFPVPYETVDTVVVTELDADAVSAVVAAQGNLFAVGLSPFFEGASASWSQGTEPRVHELELVVMPP